MAKRIVQEDCIQCGICAPECPNEGIAEVDGLYVIDPNLCTECFGFHESSRCVEVCPTDAIEDDPEQAVEVEVLAARAVHLRPEAFPRD